MYEEKFLDHTNSEEAGIRVFAQTGLSGERIVKAVLQGGEKVCSCPQPIRRREDTRLTTPSHHTPQTKLGQHSQDTGGTHETTSENEYEETGCGVAIIQVHGRHWSHPKGR